MPEVLDYRTSATHPLNLPNIPPASSGGSEVSSAPEESSSRHEERSSQSDERPQSAGQKDQALEQDSEVESSTNGEAESHHSEPGHKSLSRYEKTKRKIAQLKEREAKLNEREQQLARVEQERIEKERKASEPDYTIGDLEKYKKQWEQEGNYDLAQKAEAEIQRLQALEASKRQLIEVPQFGTPEFKQSWEQAEQELYQYDPEFMRAGTRVDQVLRELMNGPDGNLYRQHPRGIVAAYHLAKLSIAEQDLASERQKTQVYEKEIQRLNGLLGIGGGAPARGSGPFEIRDFSRLSTADMKRHLLAEARR
jgi:hypothetical protein